MKRILIVLIALIIMCSAFGDKEDYTHWWIYYYGDYLKTGGEKDPRVQWAKSVFERVKNVADKVAYRTPRLFITKSRFGPFALALPDGGIIIQRKTLDICYANVTREKGDSRLAFISGHELAHLAKNDFMHREAFMALEKYGSKKTDKDIKPIFESSDAEQEKDFQRKELMADKMGALYAFMAGYDIAEIFSKEDNFLSLWADQTGIGQLYDKGIRHPSFEKRLQFIRTQLSPVVEHLELFTAGVLLYQKGNYEDAASAFIEFSKLYPAREVFNNTGACYFNLALKRLHEIDSKVYYRFRLSAVVDYATSAEGALTFRGDEVYLKDKLFSRRIDKAEKYFRTAVEKDSQNITSLCNLSAVLILKGRYARAQAECDLLLERNPKDVRALNNKAIAFYYYGQKEDLDTTPKAIELLHKANRIDPGNFEVLYNLASLKEMRERLAGAKSYWEKYLKIAPTDNYYSHVYQKLKGTPPPETLTEKSGSIPPLEGDAGIGEAIAKIEKKWGKSKTRKYEMGNEGTGEQGSKNEDHGGWSVNIQVIAAKNVRILGLNGMVEIVERKIESPVAVSMMLERLGKPGVIIRHPAGNFYLYKNKGFSFKEVNGKVQSYIWFERNF